MISRAFEFQLMSSRPQSFLSDVTLDMATIQIKQEDLKQEEMKQEEMKQELPAEVNIADIPIASIERRLKLTLNVRPRPKIVLKLWTHKGAAARRARRKLTPVTVLHEFTFGPKREYVKTITDVVFLRNPDYARVHSLVRKQHKTAKAAIGFFDEAKHKQSWAAIMPDGSRLSMSSAHWNVWNRQALMDPKEGEPRAKIVMTTSVI
ncbi:hypothetical protein LTR22_015838 [Elasticomyces elasticus]|nr:hypothetical protein LTR22_015838 [Elasticomyces elasticus]KAK4914836.1 hypothetical protein LTR49_016948 [Elasticomyces elasticus]